MDCHFLKMGLHKTESGKRCSTWSRWPWTAAWAGDDVAMTRRAPWRWVTVFVPTRRDFYPLPLPHSISFNFPLVMFLPSPQPPPHPPLHLVCKWTPCPPLPLSSVESDDWLLIAASPPFFTYVKLLVERAAARSCHVSALFPLAVQKYEKCIFIHSFPGNAVLSYRQHTCCMKFRLTCCLFYLIFHTSSVARWSFGDVLCWIWMS